MSLTNWITEQVDRTQAIFYTAGLLFALGVWSYVWGFMTKTPTGSFQYDAVSLLPCLLSISCIMALNLLFDRQVLLQDNLDFMGGSNNRLKRFIVFALFILTMTSVAIAIVENHPFIRWF